MGIDFTERESSVLYGLLAEHTSDIILKTDRDGFVRHASPAIERLGLRLRAMLIWPHILDLVEPDFAAAIASAHASALAGNGIGDWIECAARGDDGERKWFEIQMRSLCDSAGDTYGVLGVMRSIEETRTLEDRLFVAEMTDPLTGLTNRKAFTAMLGHLARARAGGCLALFDLDHFRAFNLRNGQAAGDRMLVAFSDFLRNVTRSSDILSRVGGESFGVLMPDTPIARAERECRRIVDTLADLGRSKKAEQFPVTASAGLVPIGASLDTTLTGAELAVFFAKARGRNCLECGPLHRAA